MNLTLIFERIDELWDMAIAHRSLDDLNSVAGFDVSNGEELTKFAREAIHRRHSSAIELILELNQRFSHEIDANILYDLLLEDWHQWHENIVSILRYKKDKDAIESLYRTIFKDFEYLDYDETYALAVKCLWALAYIGTNEAKSKLEYLSSDRLLEAMSADKRSVIKTQAADLLRKFF